MRCNAILSKATCVKSTSLLYINKLYMDHEECSSIKYTLNAVDGCNVHCTLCNCDEKVLLEIMSIFYVDVGRIRTAFTCITIYTQQYIIYIDLKDAQPFLELGS